MCCSLFVVKVPATIARYTSWTTLALHGATQIFRAAGEMACALAGEVSEAEEVEGVLGPRAHLVLAPAHLRPRQPVLPQVLAVLPVGGDHEVLQHGEAVELVRDLKGAHQAAGEAPVRQQQGDVLRSEEHTSELQSLMRIS